MFTIRHAQFLLGTLYIVAAIALFTPWFVPSLAFTHVLLIVSLALLVWAQKPQKGWFSFIWRLVASAGLGFLLELKGIQTGRLFGDYVFLETLGWKLWGVPLLMGGLWAMLPLMAVNLVPAGVVSPLHRAVSASVLLAVFDILLERSASFLHWWQFVGGVVTLDNTIGWLVTGFCTAFLLVPAVPPVDVHPRNPLALPLFLCLVFYFGGAFVVQFLVP